MDVGKNDGQVTLVVRSTHVDIARQKLETITRII